MHNRYYPLSAYFRSRFGRRVQKIPLDGAATCPNRDGTISTLGCAFCNPKGSGTGLGSRKMSLTEQYLHWQTRLGRKYKAGLFMIYLQSYTNTYGPISRLKDTLRELAALPDAAGLCIGTRPDCLDKDKVALLSEQPWEEIWLDMGLQSCNDSTLQAVNRGHTARDFSRACGLAASRDLKVCAHVIAGLPGENRGHFLQTIEFLNHLGIQGIKIHNLYICRETKMAEDYRAGRYHPLTRWEYAQWVVHGLERLDPGIVVHRLNGDPVPGELIAPQWAENKAGVLETIRYCLREKDTWQGRTYCPQIPDWFQAP
ncbi:MAG: TIGR01212 family radical SAM protein [Desulfonatronovibrionaceae bacterium]